MAGISPGKRNRALYETLAFLLRLLILVMPLYLILYFSVDLTSLTNLVAWEASVVLETMGYQVERTGSFMLVHGGSYPQPFRFYISPDSSGWKSLLLLSALIIAVPKVSWKKRSIGLAIGLPIVWLGNLARVVSIVVIERSYGLEAGMLAHDMLWRFGLSILVLSIWLGWMHYLPEQHRWQRPKRGISQRDK